MYAAQFVNGCGFNQWSTNSRIVHAVGDTADGPFVVAGVVWPVFAHNPAVIRGPAGEWIMTFVSNTSAAGHEATCEHGRIITNATIFRPYQHNYLSVATSPYGPWSTPMQIDRPFDAAVPPFIMHNQPNRNTNLAMSIASDGSMRGLWRRCCTHAAPTPGPTRRRRRERALCSRGDGLAP